MKTDYNNAENAAKLVFNDFWGERSLPVDPVLIAKELGLQVIKGDLPDNISGALIKESGMDPVILLNSNDSPNRQRFSCAHEIGHYIDRQIFQGEADNDNAHNYEYVDLRGDTASQGTEPAEIFANQFAAELLMPRDAVKKLVDQNRCHGLPSFADSLKVSSYFGVSGGASSIRLNYLGLDVDERARA